MRCDWILWWFVKLSYVCEKIRSTKVLRELSDRMVLRLTERECWQTWSYYIVLVPYCGSKFVNLR